MECPGLNSIFTGIAIDLVDGHCPTAMSWHVTSIDSRFRRIELDVSGGGIAGTLNAFVRFPPVKQPGMAEIRAAVTSDQFAGQRALIVGGSRGLGEITAKIVAAGGGVPTITYSVGRADVDEVAAEIAAAGRECDVIHYDALLPAGPQLSILRQAPSSFYYFATPPIFRRKTALYEPDLLREFVCFFVDGFYDLCSALRACQARRLVGFYPSTIAIEAPLQELMEYSLAKIAGEALCAQLRNHLADLDIIVERLPRTQTDQTATVLAVDAEPPLNVMLPIVQSVQAVLNSARQS
jgi:hypothetical protein